ncbi:MAG: GH116 family glycosyl hydrolase [Caldivirga sp.]|jgi:uncharacterized protein (DUF608 family)|uniref:GH116 family glycosyl hydrolase n=1 Tax=Caldivirga sp. TaxID=2080243 RepID=UPI003D0CB735
MIISGRNLNSGLPLGGIGAGAIEFFPDLTIGNVTIMNNWLNPIKVIRGFHIVLLGEEPLFLQSNPGKNVEVKPQYRHVDNIEVEAQYPRIKYKFANLPISEIEFYTPIIKGDVKNSSLPLIIVRVKGDGTIAFSFPNIVGSRRWGRVNYSITGKVNGVLFRNLKSLQSDPAYGEVFIGCEGCFTYSGYSYWVPTRGGMTEDISVFSKLGKLNDEGRYFIRPYAREEIAGVVWKRVEDEALFFITWFFNSRPYHYPYGHYYENFFNSAIEVAEYALENNSSLKPLSVNTDDWLRDAVLNSLYVLTSSTWLTKDGRLAVYESLSIAPLMSTIGSMTWDGLSFALLDLYPDLTVKMDELLGFYTRNGEVPHDFGEESLEDPIYGASYLYPWNDLGSTWVLMIYRDYLITGNVEVLKRNFNRMREVIDWLISRDYDGDCIPDSRGGFDNSYDGTNMYGASSYIASLFLCSLQALIKSAEVLGVRLSDKYELCLSKGKDTLNSLWNGHYFVAWRSSKEGSESCMNSQLLGQFWCDFLKLPALVDDDKIKGALRSIYELNHRSSPHCLPNSVKPNGEIDSSSGQMRSCWPRVSFVVAAHMVLRGMVNEGLEIAKKEWNTISRLEPWNQSSRIDAIEGRNVGLDHYIGSASPYILYLVIRDFTKSNKVGHYS